MSVSQPRKAIPARAKAAAASLVRREWRGSGHRAGGSACVAPKEGCGAPRAGTCRLGSRPIRVGARVSVGVCPCRAPCAGCRRARA